MCQEKIIMNSFFLFPLQQAVVEEPQNLTAPVTVVGEKGEIAAMLSAYIQTTGDMTSTHSIIIDSSDRSVKMFQQQRLPSLSSLPPMKKVKSGVCTSWFFVNFCHGCYLQL